MISFNLTPETLVTSVTLQRFDVDKRGDKAGWYAYHDGDIPAGVFGNWREGLSITWCSKKVSDLTWKQSNSIVGQGHPYLIAKNIKPHHLRLSKRGDLVIPELDGHGEIWALQFIKHTPHEEREFEKKFLYMGRRDGLFFEIPGGDHVYLCEGFSTGAAIAEATGATVVCAFNAESLPKVARVLKGLYLGRTGRIGSSNEAISQYELQAFAGWKKQYRTIMVLNYFTDY